jgi:hypothetical protein
LRRIVTISYAIGITLAGVQVFRYRGERRHCLPGQCHVLHPDEMHDGGAGSEAERVVHGHEWIPNGL